ncbi:GET complex subunit get1 [Linderina macrospora]|uniref:GET complex subunit get1 n=1 Tax=Linderina macrospora TaxID=4868 RepID=A0ACC1JAF0_9FUNG|nr:GET complex subunit get1 [Linderina macrospora]
MAGCLLLTIFVVELLSVCLEAIGYSTLAQYLWATYCTMTNNQKASERNALKESITQLRRELRTVSSVDEFAKWAKMRRRLDSLSSTFETVSSELALERTAFELYVNLALRVAIYGVRTVISLWFWRAPVFYVPRNWFYPGLWVLALPGAPKGSVSVAVWAVVCNRVCKQAGRIVNRVWRPIAVEAPQQEQQRQQQVAI